MHWPSSSPAAAVAAVEARLLSVPLPAELRATGYDTIGVPFVVVRDVDGAEGTGFAYTLDGGARIVPRMIEEIVAPLFVGRSPSEWEAVRDRVSASTRRLGATMFAAALSAVDIAVWDLRGNVAAEPLYRLLGGSSRMFPFYGSGRSGGAFSTRELVEQSEGYLADGFAGVKISVGARTPRADAERVRAVRAAIGDEAPLMADASEQLSRESALEFARLVGDLGLVWFEEPMPAEDVEGYAELARLSPVPIATGEHFQSTWQFERYLAETRVAVYQPDAALGGGIGAILEAAERIRERGLPISWHSLADLHVHLAAAAPATEWIEDFPILDGIIAAPLRPSAGSAAPPERPGHGILWDRSAISAYEVR